MSQITPTRVADKLRPRLSTLCQSEKFTEFQNHLEDIAIKPDEEVELAVQNFISNTASRFPQELDEDKTSVLHIAVNLLSFNREQEKNLLNWIIEKYPEAIRQPRSGDFKGQLPLHMAICQGNTELVVHLLDKLKYMSQKTHQNMLMECLHMKATGRSFHSNIMEAELPLSIATLRGNTKLVDCLLRYGAKPTKKNSMGHNVLHSIILHAFLYPEKAELMLEMIEFLMEKSSVMHERETQHPKKYFRLRMLLEENKLRHNPLQLALQYGQVDIFKYILEKAYMHTHGLRLFDVEEYDMTDVDMSLTFIPNIKKNQDISTMRGMPSELQQKEKGPSPLDSLLSFDTKTSKAFLKYHPLSRLIRQRWFGYRWIFYGTFLLHLGFMIMLTVAAVYRAEKRPVGGVDNITDVINEYVFSFQADGEKDIFAITIGFISLTVAILYICQEIVRFCKLMHCTRISFFSIPSSHNTFRLLFVLFAILLLADFIATWLPNFEDYFMVSAIFIGWFLVLFFLRAIRRFCQFTSLIQTVMVEIIRFSVIIFIELIAFTTALYVLIRGSELEDDEKRKEFQTQWIKALFLLFQQIFGLGEIPLSNIRNRLIVNIVYVVFIVMTTCLLLNALIAIMSNTCTELFNSSDVIAHLRLHQYSVIRFFESILPDSYVVERARRNLNITMKYRYHHKSGGWIKEERCLVLMDSLRSISDDSVATTPEGVATQQNTYSNEAMRQPRRTQPLMARSSLLGSISDVILPNIRSQKAIKTDSVEIHHMRMGLCDKCHSQYHLPKSKLNKTVPSG